MKVKDLVLFATTISTAISLTTLAIYDDAAHQASSVGVESTLKTDPTGQDATPEVTPSPRLEATLAARKAEPQNIAVSILRDALKPQRGKKPKGHGPRKKKPHKPHKHKPHKHKPHRPHRHKPHRHGRKKRPPGRAPKRPLPKFNGGPAPEPAPAPVPAPAPAPAPAPPPKPTEDPDCPININKWIKNANCPSSLLLARRNGMRTEAEGKGLTEDEEQR